jgi:hypothetical protein
LANVSSPILTVAFALASLAGGGAPSGVGSARPAVKPARSALSRSTAISALKPESRPHHSDASLKRTRMRVCSVAVSNLLSISIGVGVDACSAAEAQQINAIQIGAAATARCHRCMTVSSPCRDKAV